MLAFSVAFAVAAFALFGNIALHLWRRHWDRRGLASAVAGELGAYLDLIQPKQTIENFRKLASADAQDRARVLPSLLKPPQGHPVFDKMADKIGLLHPIDTKAISEIYNVVTGFRILVSSFSTPEFIAAPTNAQNLRFNQAADIIEKYAPRGRALIQRLDTIADESISDFLRVSFTSGF